MKPTIHPSPSSIPGIASSPKAVTARSRWPYLVGLCVIALGFLLANLGYPYGVGCPTATPEPVVLTDPPHALLFAATKWCGIAQAPSMANPALACQGDFRTVLWRRHERASDPVWIPQSRITLRAGPTWANNMPYFNNYTTLTDPDLTVGAPGDVVVQCSDPFSLLCNTSGFGFELENIWAQCDAYWNGPLTALTSNPKGWIVISANNLIDETGAPVALGVAISGSLTQPYAAVADPTVGCQLNERALAQAFGVVLGMPADFTAGNLMHPSGSGATLSSPQALNARTLLAANTVVDPPDIASNRVAFVLDPRGDGALHPWVDITKTVLVDDTPTGGNLRLAAAVSRPIPSGSNVVIYFLLDADNNPGTGATNNNIVPGTPMTGVDFVGRVVRSGTNVSATLFRQGPLGNFVVVSLPAGSLKPIIRHPEHVLINPFPGRTNNTRVTAFSEIELCISNSVLATAGLDLQVGANRSNGLFPNGIKFQSLVQNQGQTNQFDFAPNTALTSGSNGAVRLPLLEWPTVTAQANANRGQSIVLTVARMHPNAMLKVFVGGEMVGMNMTTDTNGGATFAVNVPVNAPAGPILVTVGHLQPQIDATADTVITIRTNAALLISCPANVTNTTCGTNRVVTYPAPTVTGGALRACAPASGSTFNLGSTAVTCTATNAFDTNTCTFSVVVVQTPAVNISCPANMTNSTCGANTVVAYPAPTVTGGALRACVPASGSLFNVGSTVVTCTATNACFTNTCTFNVVVLQLFAPSITSQPVSQTVCSTNTATFTVGASGTAPLTYQWRLNVGNIAGATSSSFTTATAGGYSVRVSNTCGAVTSVVATLTISACPPVLTRVIPDEGFAGQIITIEGTGFGQNPDNLCLVVMNGTTAVPLQVLTATDTRLTALIGDVPPDAQPGLLMVALGVGTRTFPQIPGTLAPPDPGWAWRLTGPKGVGNVVFRPKPAPLPSDKLQFVMEPMGTNGVLCTFIEGAWPTNSIVTVHARVHDHTPGGAQSGDLFSRDVLIPGGSAFQCGQTIAEIIRTMLGTAGVPVVVTVSQAGPRVKIQVALPGGATIDWGILTICCRPAPRPPVITDFNPKQAVAGSIVTIDGTGFEEGQPDNHCAVFNLGGRFIDIEVLDATPTRLIGRIGPIPSNHVGQAHTLMVAKGWGVRPPVVPGFIDVQMTARPWVWKGAPLAAAVAQAQFSPLALPVPPLIPALHSGPPAGGVLQVRLNIDWQPGQEFCINARIHGPGFERCDTRIPRTKFSGAGTRLQCATRICDLLKAAFAAHPIRPRTVNCTATTVGGDAVITLSFADGTPITGGEIDIVPKPAPAPVITAITPATAAPGERVVFHGEGFGRIADNICLIARQPCGRLLGFNILRVEPNVIEAVLPDVPGFAAGVPHEVRIGMGEGVRRAIIPDFADVQLFGDPWAWRGVPGDMTVAPVPFIPLPPPPQPWRNYNSPCPTNGVLCLLIDGDWGAGQTVCIGARIHQKDKDGADCNFSGVKFTGSGSRFDCALRICDLIKQAFANAAAPLTVNCTVTAVGNNAKITLSLPGGAAIDDGYIDITCKPTPVITDVLPRNGGRGDVITIMGTGFDPVPENHCAVIRFGDAAVPLRVLEALGDRLIAEIGCVPENARPGPVMIGLGRGVMGRFQPAFPDVIVEDDAWVWEGNGVAAIAPVQFFPRPCPPEFGVQWFRASLVNGRLCTIIEGNWQPGTTVQVLARAHSATVQRDLDVPRTRFVGSGTTLQCALRMKDIITCAFRQQGGVEIDLQVTDLGGGRVKLTASLPPKANGAPDPITWGLMDICVSRPTLPVITSVTPTMAMEGTLLTVRGSNFLTNPLNLCEVVIDGPTGFVPLEALSATSTEIIARVGPVRPGNSVVGPVMIAFGQGALSPFLPVFPDMVVAEPVFTLRRTTEPSAISPGNISVQPSVPDPGETKFYGSVSNGMLCVFISGNWPSNACVSIWGGIDDTNRPIHGEIRAKQLIFPAGGTLSNCVARIADSILCPFSQGSGIRLQKQITQVSSNLFKLTIWLNVGTIHKGNLAICVKAPRPAPTITSVSPLTVAEGTILTINGTNLGTDSNNVCAIIMGPRPIPLRAISASNTQIRAVVGAIPTGTPAGPIGLNIGSGGEALFRPAFEDTLAPQPAWTLTATTPGVSSGQQVTPTASVPTPLNRWFFSTPVTNGMVMLVINTNFGPNTKFIIRGRFVLNGVLKDIDVDVPCFIWRPGGSALEAARRLCDGPVCALFQRLGIRINCQVTDLGGGQAKITITYPTSPILSGSFNVCASPAEPIAGPVITSVTPLTVREGDVLTINGTGFGNNPDNVCAVIGNGASAIALRALTATDTRITAEVMAVSPAATAGPVMLTLGVGSVGTWYPSLDNVLAQGPAWTLVSTRAGTNGTQNVAVIPSTPGTNGVLLFSPPVSSNSLCLVVSNLPACTKVSVSFRLRLQTGAPGGIRDIDADTCLFLTNNTSALGVAQALCDGPLCALFQRAGVTNLVCQTVSIGPGVAKIILTFPGATILSGTWTVRGLLQPKPTQTTPADVAAYIRDNILGGSFGDVTLWTTDTALEGSFVARDPDPTVQDAPFPPGRQWLVMIDDAPDANFSHPVRWLFVRDDLAGHTTPARRQWPPTVWAGGGAGAQVAFGCKGLTLRACVSTFLPALTNIFTSPLGKKCLYAVLISGGYNNGANYSRYPQNLRSIYQKLRACGFRKANIYVYYADGTKPIDCDNLDGDGNDATGSELSGAASEVNIRGRLQTLCATLNPLRDVLFIYGSNHGSDGLGLNLWDFDNDGSIDANEVYAPAEFAADTKNCRACRVFAIFDQCYSGEFTPVATDGMHQNMAVYAAATDFEVSWGREYPDRWEDLNPSALTMNQMHANVSASMALLGRTTTMAEGTPGIGNVSLCRCWTYIIIRPGFSGIVLSFDTEVGVTYTVESSTDLRAWSVSQTVAGTGDVVEVTEPLGTGHRFFRVREP